MKTARDAYTHEQDEFEIYDSSELEPRSMDGGNDDENDAEVNDDDEDMDELSRPARRRRVAAPAAAQKGGRGKKGASSSLARPNPRTRGRQPLGKGSARTTNANANPAAVNTASTTSGKPKRTYGRRAVAEDIENELVEEDPEGSDAFDGADDASVDVGRGRSGRASDKHGARGKLSAELATAKEKFERVDEWELEFESCDVGGGGSSPWR